jgi:hypothetical protein
LIPPAWRASTTTLFLLGFLAPIDCSKIPAQGSMNMRGQEYGIYSTTQVRGHELMLEHSYREPVTYCYSAMLGVAAIGRDNQT